MQNGLGNEKMMETYVERAQIRVANDGCKHECQHNSLTMSILLCETRNINL